MTAAATLLPPADAGAAPPAAAPAGPTHRRWWRRPGVLGTAGVLGILLLVVVLTLLATGSSRGDDLDPRSAHPTGTLALAELLRARGVSVDRGGSGAAGTTLVVPFANRLDAATLGRILDASSTADRIVLLSPPDVPGTGVTEGSLQGVRARDPDCDLAAARTAAGVEIGGRTYRGASTSCYGGSLATTRRGPTELVLLGSAGFLSNGGLDHQGDAALALAVLSGAGLPGAPSAHVVWYRPALDPAASRPGLLDLLPRSVPWAVGQLLFAVAILALWRGRRLGPVVEEPLPVVVPAAETVEGRARLYAAGRARPAAAAALRAGVRARLGGVLERGGEPDARGLVQAVAARAGRHPAEVAVLLYGSAGAPTGASGPVSGTDGPGAVPGLDARGDPVDDPALVRLADALDRLEREVRAR